MKTYKQSTLTFDEWIRLNDVTEPFILEASDTLAEQERIIEEQEEEIEQLKVLIHSLDLKTLKVELDWIEQCCGSEAQTSIIKVTKILDNYKQSRMYI